MRPLSHADHRRFVETEGWQKKGTARSTKNTGDHHRYTLTLETGDILHTRVSHGSGAISDPNLVAAILREQLQVTEADFYACVNDGTLPPRPSPARPPTPSDGLDAKLVRNLIRKVGLSQSEVAAMDKEQAVAAWTAYLSRGRRPGT